MKGCPERGLVINKLIVVRGVNGPEPRKRPPRSLREVQVWIYFSVVAVLFAVAAAADAVAAVGGSE